MAEPATRVAVLARPGAACDNLQAALRQAGAEVVAVQDPGDGDPAAIVAARPAAVLVALEPAVEESLDRYDAVLSAPGRLVIYDEVAIAAKREGWEAARWARHLAAKLGGHADVLPPGAGNDDAPAPAPAPRVPERAPEPQQAPEAVFSPEPAPEPQPSAEPEAGPVHARESVDAPAFDAATAPYDADSVHLGVEPAHEDVLAKAGEGIDFGGFTPEIMAAMALDTPPEPTPHVVETEQSRPDEGAHGEAPHDEAAHDEGGLAWETPVLPVASPRSGAQSPEPSAPAPVRLTADEMTLVDIESAASTGSASASSLGAASGGVVVLAGIGGPDAVRQFLAALPGGLARPIVVRQRLDGGRHDRLVRQMQRATALPVELAEAGRMLIPGHVYILPDGMTTSGGGVAKFTPTEAAVPVLAGFQAADSALLMLSGSDPASVPEVLEAAREGAYVAGQSPEESFDGAAAAALVAAGGESCTATELAQRVSARWNT